MGNNHSREEPKHFSTGSGYLDPSQLHTRIESSPARIESSSNSPSAASLLKSVSSRTHSPATSRTFTPIRGYSGDTPWPPREEEEVCDMRWVGFLTLVDRQGGHYRQRSSTPAAYGGFSDVWQCDAMFSDGSSLVVAVKRLRAVKLPPGLDESQTTKALLRRLKKELRIWMRLQHPNVAPLLGFTFDEEIAIISPWFRNGNVSNYLEAHPEADRMRLVRGVAAGLEYLHSSSPVVVHGDMKPDNVLIDSSGRPRIIDFGLSKMVEDDPSLSSLQSTSLRGAGNARWIAPELLLEEDVSRSRRTDMYSFGCVAFFIFTDDIPFKGIPDEQLVIARHKGASPIRDGAVYPILDIHIPGGQMVLTSCWNTNPQARPEVGDFVKLLNPINPGSDPSVNPWSSIRAFLRRIIILICEMTLLLCVLCLPLLLLRYAQREWLGAR